MLQIDFSRQAEKFLRNLPVKPARQLAQKLVALQQSPYPPDSKLLKGYPNWYRATSGEYRIIYTVQPEILVILLIGKRNDDEVYRLLERQR